MDVGFKNAQSTIMAEIYLANQPTVEGEAEQGLTLPGELTNPEGQMPDAPEAKGFLMAEGGKYYGMQAETFALQTLKFSEMLSDAPSLPKETKSFERKEKENLLSFSEKNKLSEKEFKILDVKKNHEVQEKLLDPKKETVNKTHLVAQKILTSTKEASKPPLTQPPLKMGREEIREHSQKKTERREEKHLLRNEQREAQGKEKSAAPSQEKERVQRKQEQEERKKEKEREGFHEDQKKKKDPEHDEEALNKKVSAKENIRDQIIQYGSQDSHLGDLLKMRVSQFDILLLFLELMKLAIKSRELERISRWQERELQIYHMQKVVENLKTQGRNLMMAGIGSGVVGIAAGLCPIVGHLKGDWIRDKLGLIPFLDKFRDMETNKLFKGLGKMLSQMSQVQKSWGEVQRTFGESNRTHDQHLSDLHKTDGDEDTRTMEEIKDYWKNIENFLYQTMQMNHDVVRQLYNA